MTYEAVPPKSLDKVMEHVAQGGKVIVPTYTRVTVMDAKVFKKFENAGYWLLKEDGDGYRMRSGKSSVYILPGQLKFA